MGGGCTGCVFAYILGVFLTLMAVVLNVQQQAGGTRTMRNGTLFWSVIVLVGAGYAVYHLQPT
jgi:hypothetical protein